MDHGGDHDQEQQQQEFFIYLFHSFPLARRASARWDVLLQKPPA